MGIQIELTAKQTLQTILKAMQSGLNRFIELRSKPAYLQILSIFIQACKSELFISYVTEQMYSPSRRNLVKGQRNQQ